MDKINVKRDGNILMIGDDPQLVVNLENQKNYIAFADKQVPYQQEVVFSEDLLAGKRENVFQTAVNYYYEQACEFIQGIIIAEEYRSVGTEKNGFLSVPTGRTTAHEVATD